MEQFFAAKMHISLLNFLQKRIRIRLQRAEKKLQRASYTILTSCNYWIRLANNKFTFFDESTDDDILYNKTAISILGINSNLENADEINLIKQTEEKYKDEIDKIKSNYKELSYLYAQVNDHLKTLKRNGRVNRNKCFSLLRAISKFYKKIHTEFKYIREIIADKRANPQKIDLKKVLHSILEFFPILGVLILFGGFLYQYILFWLFSINIVDYSSSLTDYITYSFKTIVNQAIPSALIFIFIIYKSAVDKARLHKKIIEKQNKQNRLIAKCVIPSIIIPVTGIFILTFQKATNLFYSILPNLLFLFQLLIMLLILVYTPKLQKYFKISQGMVVFVWAILLFFLAIIATAISDWGDIKSGVGKTITENFVFKNNFSKKHLIPIANNNQHYFFYDLENKRSYIVPKEDVNYIYVDNK